MTNFLKTMKNMKEYTKLVKLSKDIDKHLAKHCLYCDINFGEGDDVLVVDFINHLLEEHPEKLNEFQLKKYKEFSLSFS